MEVRFDVQLSPSKKQQLVLHHFPVIVGRQRDCKVRITSRMVSRKHCELSEQDGRIYVSDLGSSNGTFINGRRIQGEVELGNGDELEIGPVRMIASYQTSQNASNSDEGDPSSIVVAETSDDPLADVRETHPAADLFRAVDGDETSLVRDSSSSPDSDDFWNIASEDSSAQKPGESPF